jgi:hypothetical protein
MRKFVKQDYLYLCNWMIKRDRPAPEHVLLPPTGLIVDNAAAGFLIKCDNNFGILDFFITNPDIPSKVGLKAVDEIAGSLIDMAKRCGIKVIKCDTEILLICQMARKHGFEKAGVFKSFVRRI